MYSCCFIRNRLLICNTYILKRRSALDAVIFHESLHMLYYVNLHEDASCFISRRKNIRFKFPLYVLNRFSFYFTQIHFLNLLE